MFEFEKYGRQLKHGGTFVCIWWCLLWELGSTILCHLVVAMLSSKDEAQESLCNSVSKQVSLSSNNNIIKASTNSEETKSFKYLEPVNLRLQ